MNKIAGFPSYVQNIVLLSYFRIALLMQLIIKIFKEKYNNIYDFIADLFKSCWNAKEKL